MHRFSHLLLALALLTGLIAAAKAETIVAARYISPTERYGHFALGKPHEYAELEATIDGGRRVTLQLAGGAVFEDLAPRLVRLSDDGAGQLLTIISRRDSGAQLALIGLAGGRLEAIAQSAPIGTPMRWLNPVGVADLDGDGQTEIAAVITPHISGTLKVYRLRGDALIQVAALRGFSNHSFGSTALDLSAIVQTKSGMRLAVPDATRNALRIVAFKNLQLIETERCSMPSPITGAVRSVDLTTLSVTTATGQQVIDLATCIPAR